MATRKKRPVRQVWCLVNAGGVPVGVYPTRRAAKVSSGVALSELDVAGPYVLSERAAQR